MHTPQLRRFAVAVLTFVLGVCVGTFGHELLSMTLKAVVKNRSNEAMRVTSPDGELDAVLVEDSSGGALGGIFGNVYVLPKGKAAPKDATSRVFFADELTKGTIVWNKPHLIEIRYDKASIMQFSNVSTTSENGLEYVELRLVPSSEYSLLTPEGGWRTDN